MCVDTRWVRDSTFQHRDHRVLQQELISDVGQEAVDQDGGNLVAWTVAGLHKVRPMGCMWPTGAHCAACEDFRNNIDYKKLIAWKLKMKYCHQQWVFELCFADEYLCVMVWQMVQEIVIPSVLQKSARVTLETGKM
jgi:hypothetical protein